jgi:hypothetical protein
VRNNRSRVDGSATGSKLTPSWSVQVPKECGDSVRSFNEPGRPMYAYDDKGPRLALWLESFNRLARGEEHATRRRLAPLLFA